MNMYDVVWSDSEEKWVARSVHLRFVGDNIFGRKDFEKGRTLETAQNLCNEKNK